MSAKILRQNTIIPRDLYVARSADRQLRDVLNDMGRPGYVLVARQMGKTNLLLNAKREMQDSDNIFVYIDLTNRLATLRECFRSIIDVALETHDEIERKVGTEIRDKRSTLFDFPAHKEHEIELRTLLRSISGKLVIILDEIDALTNQDYSDQFFAQIRSTFFSSRVNFPEFDRLTYILSGVAEPTEIIKNPKISPFNIGIKIYLADFTYEEYCTFLSKSRLELSPEIRDQIFSWVNGNPRMTWDICSAVEDKLLMGQNVTAETIDGIVKKLYLERFDFPPIDHIRNLVESERAIRNAIVEIRYGKGHEVSDAIRSKLYLAGITKATDGAGLNLKNRVIDLSLSEQWLSDIDKRQIGAVRLANEKFKAGQFEEAIPLFEEHLRSMALSDVDRTLTANFIGRCYFNLKKYDNALVYFQKTFNMDEESSPELWAEQKHRTAWCNYYLAKIEEAQMSLLSALKLANSATRTAVISLWLLGSIPPNAEQTTLTVSELERICHGMLERLAKENDIDLASSLRAKVCIAAAILCDSIGAQGQVASYLQKALSECERKERPAIEFYTYKLEHDPSRRGSLVRGCVAALTDQTRDALDESSYEQETDQSRIQFVDSSIISRDDLIFLLEQLHNSDETDLFERLLNYVMLEYKLDRIQVFYSIATLAARANNNVSFVRLVRKIVPMMQGGNVLLNETQTREMYRVFLSDPNVDNEAWLLYFGVYFDLLRKALDEGKGSTVDQLDILVLTRMLLVFLVDKKEDLAIALLEKISPVRRQLHSVRSELDHEFSMIDYIAMLLMKSVGNAPASKAHASTALAVLSERKRGFVASTIIQPDTLDIMIANIKLELGLSLTINNTGRQRYRRNDWIKVRSRDGLIIEDKYKRLEAGIRDGVYQIIEE